ncbi:MAG: tetratricopeptide repeat protein [Cyanobacteria bacterium P01_D01_bin.156]
MSEESTDNKRNFRKLVLAIDASYGRLSLLMAISDNWKHRTQLIEQYETELGEKGTRCYRVKVDQQQYSLKQCLFNLTQQEPDLANQNAVVTVLGADELLGIRLRQDEKSSQEKLFFSLQWTREALRQFQVPVVLWLTPQVAGQLAKASPDFWSWRGGVFEFSKPIAVTLGEKSVAKRIETPEEAPDSSRVDPEAISKQIAELEAQDPESPLLASLYMDLGAAYETAVRYAEAATAYEKALKLRETQSGPEHVDTATSLNELANLYESMGRYSEAEPLYVRSLEIRETQQGAEHPDTATSLNNLAALYDSMGRYGEAEPLYVRAIEIDESRLGRDHPGTATDLNNLALLYESMGRYGEAEPLLVKSLEIRETQQGAEHPDTAMSLNNLASLYESMGRYSEAEPLYVRAIEIDESRLGKDHPGTATDLNNLAGLYESMGRYSEAEPLYVRVIEIDEKALPREHPYIEQDKNNFRGLLKQVIEAGKTDELSDHPLTQKMLKELQAESGDASTG